MNKIAVKDSDQTLKVIPISGNNLKKLKALKKAAEQGQTISHTFECHPSKKSTKYSDFPSIQYDQLEPITLEASRKGITSPGGTSETWENILNSKTMGFFVIDPPSQRKNGIPGTYTYMTVKIAVKKYGFRLSNDHQWLDARKKLNSVLKEQGRENAIIIADQQN